MKTFLKIVSSNTARFVKALVGLYLLILGVMYPTDYGLALAFGGAAFLLSGIMDFCVIAPLFGYPFLGQELRAKLSGGSFRSTAKKSSKSKAKKKRK